MKRISSLILLLPLVFAGCATVEPVQQDCSITPKPLIDAFGSEEGYKSFATTMRSPRPHQQESVIKLATQYLARTDKTEAGELFFLQNRARAYSVTENRSAATADYRALARLPNLSADRRRYFEAVVETGDYPLGPRQTPLPANVVDAKPLVRIPPIIPAKALNRDNSAHCAVLFDIDSTGKVINAKAEYCTHNDFAEPALNSIKLWKYSPKTIDGVPSIRENVKSRISFNLQDQCGNFFPL